MHEIQINTFSLSVDGGPCQWDPFLCKVNRNLKWEKQPRQHHRASVRYNIYWRCLWDLHQRSSDVYCSTFNALAGVWQRGIFFRKCLQLYRLLSLRTGGLLLQSPSHTVRAYPSRFKHDAPFMQCLWAERISSHSCCGVIRGSSSSTRSKVKYSWVHVYVHTPDIQIHIIQRKITALMNRVLHGAELTPSSTFGMNFNASLMNIVLQPH